MRHNENIALIVDLNNVVQCFHGSLAQLFERFSAIYLSFVIGRIFNELFETLDVLLTYQQLCLPKNQNIVRLNLGDGKAEYLVHQ